MLNQDFNDWTQAARDQNTGLKYPVRLHVSNTLALSDAHVNQANADDLSSTDLTVKGTVKNTSGDAQTGDVDATITAPDGSKVDRCAHHGQPRRGREQDGLLRPGPRRSSEALVALPDG